MTFMRLFGVVGAAATLLAACGADAPPTTPAAAAAAAAKPKAVVAAAAPDGGSVVEGAQYVYSYMPVGKRDPFRSPLGDAKSKNDLDPVDCNEPLCAFNIEQLALVAVVSGDANPIAMLEDPTHIGHIVRRNSKVGKQGGKVTQILRDCVVVTEYFMTPDGKKNPNRVNICTKKEATGVTAYDLFNNKSIE